MRQISTRILLDDKLLDQIDSQTDYEIRWEVHHKIRVPLFDKLYWEITYYLIERLKRDIRQRKGEV